MTQIAPHDRVSHIRAHLTKALSPSYLNIIDESDRHIGHVGAAGGGGHFTVQISSAVFKGKSLVASHQLIYQTLDDMMKNDIHALKIQIIRTEQT